MCIRDRVPVEVDGRRFDVRMWVPESAAAPAAAPSKRRAAASSGGGGGAGTGEIAVPMQGTIVRVNVSAGDAVASGDALVVLEAMKMENNIDSDVAGTVTEVRVAEGDSVGAGDVVVVIAPS